MIDVLNETPLTMSQAAALLPGRPHISTVWRWVARGVRGVKLATTICGARRYTTRRALEEFMRATTAAADGQTISTPTSPQRRQELHQADRELREAGI